MNIEFLSASGASVYEQCPLRYHAKYILGKKSGNTSQINAGLLAHKALEIYYRPDLKLNPEESFEKASKEEFCPDREQFNEARRIFFDLTSKEPKESTKTITTELNFEFFLESGSAARGFIDRIDLVNDKTIRIVDYKTGAFVPSKEELESSNQTNIYAAWVFLEEKFNSIDTVEFNYKYIRANLEKVIVINRNQAYDYLTYFDHLFQAIKSNEKPKPSMNSFCWNCEHRSECSEYLNAMKVSLEIKSAIKPGSKINSMDNLSELTACEMVDLYSEISTMSTCIDKEKKFLSSTLSEILKSLPNHIIETDLNIAKLSTRGSTSYPTVSKKK